MDNAPVGVAVCDSHGMVLTVNDHLARMLARTHDELVGGSFLAVIHPAEQEESKARYLRAQLLATAGRAEADSEHNEVRCVTGAGETIRVHVAWSTTPPDATGAQYAVLHVTDLTRRRVIEDELVEMRQLLEVALQWSEVGTVIVDTEKRIRFVNERMCNLLGYPREQLTQMSFEDITHPQDRAKTLAAFQQLLNGELERHQTIKRYIRSDGAVLYCRRIALAARGRDGAARSTLVRIEPIGVVGAVGDRELNRPCVTAPASPGPRGPWWRMLLPARRP